MEEEFTEIDSTRNGWNIVFQKIKNKSSDYNYTCNEARKISNRDLNRYRDVSPYDHSRIILKSADTDYINASPLNVAAANRNYILTQGPLQSTTSHFWAMVWEQESRAIVMLNKIIEKNAVKCHRYWPCEVGETMTFKSVKLQVRCDSVTEHANYTVRELLVSSGERGRTVLHFHYTAWPDFGVPETPRAFLQFLVTVREAGVLESGGPTVVHCSAGIGRSGTFCLVDACLIMIAKNGGKMDGINIQEILLDMRRSRMGLIQTPDQLRFSYLAVIEGAKQLPAVDSPLPAAGGERENGERVENGYGEEAGELPPPMPRRGTFDREKKVAPPVDSDSASLPSEEASESDDYDDDDDDNNVHDDVDVDREDEEEAPPPLPPRDFLPDNNVAATATTSLRFNGSNNVTNELAAVGDSAFMDDVMMKLRAKAGGGGENTTKTVVVEGEGVKTKKRAYSTDMAVDPHRASGEEDEDHVTSREEERVCSPPLKSSTMPTATESSRTGSPVGSKPELATTEPEPDMVLRRRARTEKTATMVRNMQQKQRQAETWLVRRRVIQRVSIGLLILVGGTLLAYRMLRSPDTPPAAR